MKLAEIMTNYANMALPKPPGDMFMSQLMSKNAWFLEVGNRGLIYVTEIIPNFTGSINVLFWDKTLNRNRPYFQAVTMKAFELFGLVRVSAPFPASNKPMHDFLKKCGFRYEGTLRRGTIIDGSFTDLVIYSVLREEATWQLPTISLD